MKLYDVIIKYVINGEVVTKTIADVHRSRTWGNDEYERFYTGKTCFRIKKDVILSLDEFNLREIEDLECIQ